MAEHKVSDLLAYSTKLRELSRQAQRLAEFQRALVSILPPSLASAVRVTSFRAGTLVVAAENNAVLAKLKQLLPRLLLHVQKRENEVTGIQLQAQVGMPQMNVGSAVPERELSLAATRGLEELASTMQTSPLKHALDRMVRRRKRVPKGTLR